VVFRAPAPADYIKSKPSKRTAKEQTKKNKNITPFGFPLGSADKINIQ
jgi:hypothetical protein